MSDDYFSRTGAGKPADDVVPPPAPEDLARLDLAPLLGHGAEGARLHSQVRMVGQVVGGLAALAALGMMILALLAVIRFFDSLPF